ncbi:hypothetical protein BDM02DRAFT_3128680 [Thelephora ganbajun]|uniref:Uncharacterized protein n=1 Tax=Thelephora ganbajun TaxID=370292 RepID=A0ACB6ZHR4_THEGA|nr:hypothetical protein BDM02DRAFT_3128680 [Thelephora ganbajun]
MSSIHDPTENVSTHASPPATDHGIDNDETNDDDGPSSEVSYGGNLRGDLEGVLKGDFDFKGKFALSETFASTPLPGLYIEGIGVIGFPLSERDAKLIEAAATQAPFGKGTETVVDTTVRDTFEINPDRFSFKNPAWIEFLRTVTKKAADGLGLSPNLPPPRADLYKLLLYKTGSHFLPHKDTEKSQGMFASLIIVLPSKFEGGAVHVSHGNDKDVFNISPSSEFATSALAWYTDVTHEVKPVTSGYRLAISYNLVNTSPGLPPPHLPDMHSAVSAVEKIFHKWKKGGYDEPDFSGTIAYLLDHQYSDAGLEFAALKGKDAILVSNIQGVAEKEGICLRLGLLECEVSGDADVYGSDDGWGPPPRMEVVHETEYRIEGLYDLEGDLAEGEDPITLNPEFDMIPQDPGFQDEDPDDEEFEGYTGNEGAPMKYWYRRSVLVMSLAGEGSTTPLEMGGAEYAFKKLRRWKAEGPTERNRQMARFLLSHGSLSASWSHALSEEVLLLIDLALEWGDFTMWQEILKESAGDGYTLYLSMDVLIRAWGVFTFDRIKHIIEKVVSSQPSTGAAIEFISAFRARVPTQDPGVKAWWNQQTTAVLSSIKSPPSVTDVQMFIAIAKSEGLLFFSKTIVKQLVEFRKIFDFWVGLAEGLWKNKDKLIPSGGTPEASVYTIALNHTIDSLIVAAIPEYHSGAVYDRYVPPTFAYAESQDFTRILRLLDLMVLTHRTQNSGRLITLVSQPQGNLLVKYQMLTTPLIPKLKARYQQYNGSEFPILDAFLRAFVERWLQDLLGTPSKQPDALVKKLICECGDCTSVNRFLRSSAVTETFWAAQKRRSHMEANLRNTLPDAVTFTTIMGRTPYGLKVTKTQVALATDKWSGRVESARTFLASVGTPDVLARIIGERYQDIQAALAGTKPYKIGNPIPIVAPVEGAPVTNTSTTRATASRTQTGPVMAGMKRKAEDDGAVIDLTSD